VRHGVKINALSSGASLLKAHGFDCAISLWHCVNDNERFLCFCGRFCCFSLLF
jgi:hypothetical protein